MTDTPEDHGDLQPWQWPEPRWRSAVEQAVATVLSAR